MADTPQRSSSSVSALVKSADSFAIASMILGLVSVLTFWVFPVCALFSGVAFVLGRVAQQRLKLQGLGKTAARGWATAGIILASSGFLLSAAIFGSCLFFLKKTDEAGQKEFGKAIQELEQDPEFKRQLEELRQDLKTLDDKPAADDKTEEKDDPDDHIDDKAVEDKAVPKSDKR